MHRSTKWGLLCGLIGLAVLGGLVLGLAVSGPADDLEATAILAGVAAVIGLPPTVAAVILLRRARRRRSLLAASGDRPWTLRDDWRGKLVVARMPAELVAAWPVGAMLLGSCALALYVTVRDDLILGFIRALGWFCGAASVVVFIWGLVYVRRRLVHGRPDLVLPEVPLVQGRRYAVSVRTGARVVEDGEMFATVECTKIEGIGKARQITKLSSECFRAKTADSHMDIERTVMPLEIDLPAGLPDREDDEDPSVRWTLTVTSDAFAARLKAAFDLPVFARPGGEAPVGETPAGETRSHDTRSDDSPA